MESKKIKDFDFTQHPTVSHPKDDANRLMEILLDPKFELVSNGEQEVLRINLPFYTPNNTFFDNLVFEFIKLAKDSMIRTKLLALKFRKIEFLPHADNFMPKLVWEA